jgi:hypothetical protein
MHMVRHTARDDRLATKLVQDAAQIAMQEFFGSLNQLRQTRHKFFGTLKQLLGTPKQFLGSLKEFFGRLNKLQAALKKFPPRRRGVSARPAELVPGRTGLFAGACIDVPDSTKLTPLFPCKHTCRHGISPAIGQSTPALRNRDRRGKFPTRGRQTPAHRGRGDSHRLQKSRASGGKPGDDLGGLWCVPRVD